MALEVFETLRERLFETKVDVFLWYGPGNVHIFRWPIDAATIPDAYHRLRFRRNLFRRYYHTVLVCGISTVSNPDTVRLMAEYLGRNGRVIYRQPRDGWAQQFDTFALQAPRLAAILLQTMVAYHHPFVGPAPPRVHPAYADWQEQGFEAVQRRLDLLLNAEHSITNEEHHVVLAIWTHYTHREEIQQEGRREAPGNAPRNILLKWHIGLRSSDWLLAR